MTIHMEGKSCTFSVLSVSFSNGTPFLNFDVENFMSDELNIYLQPEVLGLIFMLNKNTTTIYMSVRTRTKRTTGRAT